MKRAEAREVSTSGHLYLQDRDARLEAIRKKIRPHNANIIKLSRFHRRDPYQASLENVDALKNRDRRYSLTSIRNYTQ